MRWCNTLSRTPAGDGNLQRQVAVGHNDSHLSRTPARIGILEPIIITICIGVLEPISIGTCTARPTFSYQLAVDGLCENVIYMFI